MSKFLVNVLLIPLSACLLQLVLWEEIKPFPWFLFWPAMFVSTWRSTLRQGIASVVVCALLAWWFFVPEEYTFIKSHHAVYISTLFYIGIGVLVCFMHERLRQSRAHVAQLLSATEQSHRLLLESLADGVFVAQDHKFVFGNPAMPRMLGYTREEFQGLKFKQVVAPDFLDLWTRRFEQRIGSGSEPEKCYEVKFLRKTGEPMWVELRASRAQYRDRPAVLGIIRDITERKQHEAMMLLASAVFENTQESIVVTDLDCNILAVNPAFNTITEYTDEEVVGLNMRILNSGRHDYSFFQQMWHSILNFGNWQGAIWNRRKSGDIYQEWLTINTVRNERGEPIQYIGISVDVSRISHVETHMEHMAHHDALTDLPNRLLLHSRLEHTLNRAKREKSRCAVLFLDLDRFKAVNDTLGHAAGDELLKLASLRMQERLREIDTLARLGGDEFVIVLDGIHHPQEAEKIAEDIIHRLSTPFSLQNGEAVNIGSSVGISLFPEHGGDPDLLIAQADEALYKAKQGGRGRWQVYESTSLERM